MKVLWPGILAVLIPLAMIALSIGMSPWFSLENDALSDLGHATRSRAAPVFNLGLSTGGLLLVVTAVLLGAREAYRWLLASSGYFLMLIGVFDEVYGRLHFYVSLLFFATLLLLLVIYGYLEGKPLYIALAAIGVAAWYLHLAEDIPRGAAIPELISVALILPPYINIIRSGAGKPG